MYASLTPAPAGLTVTVGDEVLPVVALVLEPAHPGSGGHTVRPVVIADGKLEVANRDTTVASA